VRLVAHANVLLSALIGGRAKLILNDAAVAEILTAGATFAEIQEYSAVLARSRGLSLDSMLLAVAALPVTVVERSVFSAEIPEAKRRIGRRDPEDVELLALALHERLPIWSNDSDFADARVERYTTAQLLQRFGIR
jgi:predicted nucleic acid-binding protein